MTLSEMLDLPKDQRSRYLAAFPLTRTYVFGCLEGWHCRHIRRVITRNGGVYNECYRFPGVYWVCTFRTQAGRDACTRELMHWLNEDIRKDRNWSEDELYNENMAQVGDVPVFRFERDVWITDQRHISRPTHPIHS